MVTSPIELDGQQERRNSAGVGRGSAKFGRSSGGKPDLSNTTRNRRKVPPRQNKAHKLANELIIDKLALMDIGLVSQPVGPVDLGGDEEEEFAQSYVRREANVDLDCGLPARVTIDELRNGARRLYRVEFNPSRLGGEEGSRQNVHPAGLRAALNSVGESLSRGLRTYGSGSPPPAIDLLHPRVRITRLDLARDFVLPQGLPPAPLLQSLLPIPRPYRPPVALYARGGRNETLEIRRSEYSVVMYDQVACHKDRTMETALRFEVQLHGGALRKFGFGRPEDVVADQCVAAVQHYWEWTKMGSPVVAGHELALRLQRAGLRGKEFGNVMGYVMARELGLEDDYDPKLRKKHESVLERAGAVGVGTGLPVSGRLDLASGTFVPIERPRRRVVRRPRP